MLLAQLFIAIFVLAPFLVFAQTEPPQFMTVDGRLYDSATPEDPLLDNSVLMKIQILNPAKTCILYEEEQTVSTLSSNGYFNVRVGSPTSGAESLKRTTATIDVGNSMMQIFQNQNASISGKTSGGAGCGYIPAAGDTRYFRFVVTPSTSGLTSTLSPDMQIDSVPQSLVAETLQGMAPSNFVQTNTDVTQAKVNTLFGASYTTLSGLLAGSSSLYLQNTTNGTVIPNRATNPVAPSAGQIWYDSDDFVLRYYDGSSVLTLGTSGGDPTKLPLAGGIMSGAIDMATNDITDVGHVTQAPQRSFRFGVYTTAQQATLIATPLIAGHEGTVWYNTTTNKLMFWDGTAAFAVSPVDSVFGRTGAVVALAGDYDAVQIDNTPAGSVSATEVQAAINELATEKVAKAGDTMTGLLTMNPKGVAASDGGSIAFTELAANGTAQVGFRAPDDVTTGVIWALPAADGSAGQVLQTSGAGVLSWITAATAVADDSLNFDKFSDTLTLDASTDIAATGTNALSITNSGTGDSFRINDQAADTSPFVVDASGNVGIGTSAPTSILDISSSTAAAGVGTPVLRLRAVNGIVGSGPKIVFHDHFGTNTSEIKSAWESSGKVGLTFSTVSGNEKMRITSDGNVGIGTTTPGTILDAVGAITSRPYGTATGETGQLIMRELAVGGTDTVAIRAPDAITTSYSLTLPATAGAANQVLTTDGAGILSWTSGGSASIANDSLDFDKLTDTMTLDASTDIAASGTNALSITNSGTGDSFRINDQAADTTPFVVDASGNVGIGTTVPGSPLTINVPSSTATGNIDYVAEFYKHFTVDDTNTKVGLYSSQNVFGGVTLSALTNYRGDINTALGGSIAAVYGYTTSLGANGSIGNRFGFRANEATGTGVITNQYGLYVEPLTHATANYAIYTEGITPSYFGGSVGIGTTAPGTLLDVAGAVTSRPSGTGTGQTGQVIMRELAAGGTDTVAIRAPDAIITSYALTLPATAGAANQVLTTDGAGILSWTSGGAASIADDSLNFDKFSDTMALDASTDIAVDNAEVLSITNTGTGNSFVVNDESTDTTPFTINALGNVGVGIANPVANLHVEQNEASTQVLRASSNPFATTGDFDPVFFRAFYNSSTTNTGLLTGLRNEVTADGSRTHNGIYAMFNQLGLDNSGGTNAAVAAYNRVNVISVSGTVNNAYGSQNSINNTGAVITNAYGVHSDVENSGGTVSNAYGLYIDALAGTNRWGVYQNGANDTNYFAGNVGIGTTLPGTILDAAGAITSRPSGTGTGQTGQLVMRELAVGGTDTVAIRAPDAITASYALTLPTTAGVANQVLTTDGAGILSWTSAGAASIANDSLDFDKLTDTMTLDASTDIAATGTNVLSITNSGTGDSFRINDQAGDTTPFVIDASGNVGIGTSTPTAAGLQISTAGAASTSGIKMDGAWFSGGTGATTKPQLLVEPTGTPSTSWNPLGTGIGVNAPTGFIGNLLDLQNNGGSYFTVGPFGGVTTSAAITVIANSDPRMNFGPGSVLNINGDILGQLTYRGVNSAYGTFTGALIKTQVTDVSTASEDADLSLQTSVNGNLADRLTIANGSVGIGTTAPGTLLDVAGAVTSRPSGTGTGQTGQVIMRELAAGGTDTVAIRAPDAITTSYALTLPATAGVANQVLTTDGAGILSWTSGGAASIANDSLDFDNLTDTMTLDASTDIAATGTNALSITNSGTGDSFRINDQAGDTSPFIVDAGGNVGIGTTTAPDKLTVNGAIGIPGSSGSNPGFHFTSAGGANSYGANIGMGLDTSFNLVAAISNASFRVVTNTGSTPFMVASSGDVGIGTTLPFARNHISAPAQGTITTYGSEVPGLILEQTINLNGYGPMLEFRMNEAAQVWTNAAIASKDPKDGSHSGELLFFTTPGGAVNNASNGRTKETNLAERMRINKNGNVGIGTTTPGTILDASGAITSRPYGTATGETGQLVMRELAAGGTDTVAIRAPDALATSYALTLPATAGAANQVLTTDGAGILSWTSGGAASIADDSLNFDKFSDALALDASTDIAVDNAEVLSITNTGSASSFVVNDQAADTTPFVINASGNVGIGTTTPTNLTDVRQTLTGTASEQVMQNARLDYSPSANSSINVIGSTTLLELGGANNSSGTENAGLKGSVHSNTTGAATTGTSSGVYGLAFQFGSGSANSLAGVRGHASKLSAGDVTHISGVFGSGYNQSATGTAALITGGSFAANASLGNSITLRAVSAEAGVEATSTVGTAVGVYAKVTSSGALTEGYGVYIGDTDGTTQYGLFQAGANDTNYFAGNVGIGTTSPTDKLVVAGTIRNLAAIDRTSLATIDFSGGNIQYTTDNCGAFALHNVRSGGSYTFVVQGTVSQTCAFTAFSDAGSTALTVHMPSDHGPSTVGKHTIYTAIVAGTHIYFAWTPDM